MSFVGRMLQNHHHYRDNDGHYCYIPCIRLPFLLSHVFWCTRDFTNVCQFSVQFVLVATASDPEAAVNACLGGKESGLPRLHLFYVANKIT
jgi:hypothetical protein